MIEVEDQSAPRRAGSMRAPFRHAGFGRFVGATIVSSIGDFLNSVGLLVVVYRTTGSAGWLGVVAVLRVVAWAGATALGGVIGDRRDRRVLLTVLNLLAAAVTLVLTITTGLSAPVVVIVATSVALDLVSGLVSPIGAAAVPSIVGEEDLPAANAIITTVEQVSMIVGPALGAVLVAVSSPTVAFACNTGSYLLAAVLFAGVAMGAVRDDDEEPARFRDGITALRESRPAMVLVSIFVGAVFTFGFSIVLYVIVADERLGLADSGVGYLRMAEGIGGVLAALVAGRLAAGSSSRVLVVSTLLTGLVPAAVAATTSVGLALALLAVVGGAYVVLEVVVITWLQRITPDELLGRMMGLVMSLGALGTAAGAAIAPILVDLVGLQWTLAVSGLPLLVVLGITAPSLPEIAQRAAVRHDELEPIVEALRATALFAASEELALYQVASSIEEVTLPVGTTVIRQGDVADDLYVVRRGILDVRASEGPDGEPRSLATVGPGGWFGELGLIHSTTRAATVATTTEVDLWRIPGEVFLSAYTPLAPRPDILRNATAVA